MQTSSSEPNHPYAQYQPGRLVRVVRCTNAARNGFSVIWSDGKSRHNRDLAAGIFFQYSFRGSSLYDQGVDVAVTDLRANLSGYLSQTREGHEVLITERGIPVARLSALDATTTLERLVIEGQIARPNTTRRPIAAGRKKPRSKGSVSDLVTHLR